MKTFSDKAGREWAISIDVAAIKLVRDLTGVNLYALIEDGAKPLGELVGDPVKLVDVIYVLCREQADKLGIDDAMFGRGFAGDSLEAAVDAFVGELILFFPSRQAASLAKLMAKGKEIQSMMLSRSERQLAEIDLESLVEKLSKSSYVVRDSSASIPTAAALPSEN